MTGQSFAFVAADTEDARLALAKLSRRYRAVTPEEADIIVALGGDGFMLETLHRSLERGVPIYGMNCGTVGFLLNAYGEDDLPRRLAAAVPIRLHPLRMRARTMDGSEVAALALNEVSLLRESRQAAKIAIRIDPVYGKAQDGQPRVFNIVARNNAPGDRYIQSATLNGKPLNRCWLDHTEIVAGGILELVLGPEPNKQWGVEK